MQKRLATAVINSLFESLFHPVLGKVSFDKMGQPQIIEFWAEKMSGRHLSLSSLGDGAGQLVTVLEIFNYRLRHSSITSMTCAKTAAKTLL